MRRAFTTGAALGLIAAGGLAAASLLTGSGGARAASAPAQPESAQQAFTIDSTHSSVIFKIRHSGLSNFYGRFNEISGEVQTDASGESLAGVNASIKTESVDTKNERRDDHLRGSDFFNARQYPEISFESAEVSDGQIIGELSLHGETRTITADLTPLRTGSFRGNKAIGFEARFELKRTDYGMRKYLAEDGSDDGPLGNTVEITVAIEAQAQ